MKGHLRVVVDGTYGPQQFYNFMFRSVHAEGLDHKPIQHLEINLSNGRVRPGRYRIDETLKGVLGDDDLINYNSAAEPNGSELEDVAYRGHCFRIQQQRQGVDTCHLLSQLGLRVWPEGAGDTETAL